MKILCVIPSYWPAFKFGGPIQSVHLLNKFLAKKGIELTVYTTNAGLEEDKSITLKKGIDLDGVKVFYFPYYGYVHYTFSPSLFWALKRDVKKFDLVHIVGVWNFPVFAAAFWARIYKKPYIISPRGSLMKEPLEKKSSLMKKIFLFLFVRRDFKNASEIHFTVEMEKEEYLKANLPLGKAIVVPNAFNIESESQSYDSQNRKINFKKRLGIADDKKVILFLSRLNWKKGLDTLIPAFAEVLKGEPNSVLILVGGDDEGYSDQIKKMALSSGFNPNEVISINQQKSLPAGRQEHKSVSSSIIFTGILLGEDKIAAFRESDVFVLPSYSENFGMAVVEAMACSLPVIITKNVGISSNVEKAGAGIIIDKNEKQLSEAILKILANPDLAKKMGENGKILVEEKFSADKVAEQMIKEYNKIISHQ